jgi:hypothetical protein
MGSKKEEEEEEEDGIHMMMYVCAYGIPGQA